MAKAGVGRPSKPTTLKLLHGDRKDRVNTAEPVPENSEIKPPSWLTAGAKNVWRRLAPDLERKGVLTAWDVDAFAIYCDAVVEHRVAAEIVAKEGVLVAGYRGSKVKNPAAQLVRDYAAIITSYGGRFGLTPSDRAGISLSKEPDGKGAERLLS